MNNQIIDIEGIIVNSKNYGDTSKILDILTKDYGLINVIAKGCKSMKSSIRSVCDNLTYANFNIYYKKDKLSILNEASILDNFSNIKKDIKKISYSSFLLDLSKQVYNQNQDKDIFLILISALKKINKDFNPLIITNIVELKFLKYLGVMPNLDECNICGSKNIITLSCSKGGFVCNKCYKNEIIVSKKTIQLIRLYNYINIDSITKLDIDKKVINEINNFIDEYYDEYTGLYLKSKMFLKNISDVK